METKNLDYLRFVHLRKRGKLIHFLVYAFQLVHLQYGTKLTLRHLSDRLSAKSREKTDQTNGIHSFWGSTQTLSTISQ